MTFKNSDIIYKDSYPTKWQCGFLCVVFIIFTISFSFYKDVFYIHRFMYSFLFFGGVFLMFTLFNYDYIVKEESVEINYYILKYRNRTIEYDSIYLITYFKKSSVRFESDKIIIRYKVNHKNKIQFLYFLDTHNDRAIRKVLVYFKSKGLEVVGNVPAASTL